MTKKIRLKSRTVILLILVVLTGTLTTVFAMNWMAKPINDTAKVIDKQSGISISGMTPEEQMLQSQEIMTDLQKGMSDEALRAKYEDRDIDKANSENRKSKKVDSIEKYTIGYGAGSFSVMKVRKGNDTYYLPRASDHVFMTTSNPNYYLFMGKNQAVYLFDGKTEKVTKVTSDSVKGYNKQDVLKSNEKEWGERCEFTWAGMPILNEEATMLVYGSNRRSYADNGYEIDTWIVDLKTGQESLLSENMMPAGWYGDRLYYLTNASVIGCFDTKTGQRDDWMKVYNYSAHNDYLFYWMDEMMADTHFINMRNGDGYVLSSLVKTVSESIILADGSSETKLIESLTIDLAPIFNADSTQYATSIQHWTNGKVSLYVAVIDFTKCSITVLDGVFEDALGITIHNLLDDGTMQYTLYWDGMTRAETKEININEIPKVQLPITFAKEKLK